MADSRKRCCLSNFFAGTLCSSEDKLASCFILAHSPITGRHKKWSAIGRKSESGDAAWVAVSLALHFTALLNTSNPVPNQTRLPKPNSSLGRHQQAAIRGKNKSHLMTPDCLWLIRPAVVFQISVSQRVWRKLFQNARMTFKEEKLTTTSVSPCICVRL